jgi:hypothetical protein
MFRRWRSYFALSLSFVGLTAAVVFSASAAADFKRDIEPVLERYCYDCHTDEDAKGGVDFDEFDPGRRITRRVAICGGGC